MFSLPSYLPKLKALYVKLILPAFSSLAQKISICIGHHRLKFERKRCEEKDVKEKTRSWFSNGKDLRGDREDLNPLKKGEVFKFQLALRLIS
jgi:hypothetical protein